MAIYRIFRERAFEPEAVICMAKAYEGALVALKAGGDTETAVVSVWPASPLLGLAIFEL
jgi:hypothetical protein